MGVSLSVLKVQHVLKVLQVLVLQVPLVLVLGALKVRVLKVPPAVLR